MRDLYDMYSFGKYDTTDRIENYFNKKINIFVVIEVHNPHIFNEFYLEYKIIHESTTSYYPKLNGKAEKKK